MLYFVNPPKDLRDLSQLPSNWRIDAVRHLSHSGARFMSSVLDGTLGRVVWPIEEFLMRRPMRRTVRDRIKRLNPYGVPEGEMPRGLHRKPRVQSLLSMVVTPKEFIRNHGIDAYRRLPKGTWKHQGHRKYMTFDDYMRLTP